MAEVIRERLKNDVNAPEGNMPQFTAAVGYAILGHIRLRKLQAEQEIGRPSEVY